MKTRFIVNPSSGRNGRNRRLVAAIRAFIAEHRLDADLAVTSHPGDATDLARAALAAGCERVVAVGGDGTVNDAARALVGTTTVLALVPCGSGNGLARHLGLPLRPRRALALLTDPTARIVAIDTGTANGHPFFNVMGAGFDADISRRFNNLPQRGLAAYARAGLRAFFRHRAEPIAIADADGHAEALDAFIVAVANSDQYGNNARLAPGASVSDGLLDLVVVQPPGFFRAVALVARLFLGSFDRSPQVRRLQSARFVIRRPAPGLIHTDGETHATDATVEVAVRPLSLRLLVPAACRVGAAAGPAPSPLPPWTKSASGSAL